MAQEFHLCTQRMQRRCVQVGCVDHGVAIRHATHTAIIVICGKQTGSADNRHMMINSRQHSTGKQFPEVMIRYQVTYDLMEDDRDDGLAIVSK